VNGTAFTDWLGGIIGSIFLAMAGINYRRTSNIKKTQHEHDLAIAYLRGKSESVSIDVKLIVYEAMEKHEKDENKKFEDLQSKIAEVHTDIAVIKSTIGRAINGAGKH
jgi:hypothetical protein